MPKDALYLYIDHMYMWKGVGSTEKVHDSDAGGNGFGKIDEYRCEYADVEGNVMAKIYQFKSRENENAIMALFDMACNMIFKPTRVSDPSREVCRIVQTAITHTGANPHYFPGERSVYLDMLISH